MALIPHIVRQGEYVAQLALRYGFDADAVWNDEKNDELRALREDPNVLAPGDILFIPEPKPKPLRIRKGAHNRYIATVPTTTVTLRVSDGNGPVRGEGYRIEGGAVPAEGTTDGDGTLTCTVRLTTRVLQVVVPGRKHVTTVLLGHLDPVVEPSGLRARLMQLGYLLPLPHTMMGFTADEAGLDSDDPDEASVREALRAFQRDQSLPDTGIVDPSTADALRKAHGT